MNITHNNILHFFKVGVLCHHMREQMNHITFNYQAICFAYVTPPPPTFCNTLDCVIGFCEWVGWFSVQTVSSGLTQALSSALRLKQNATVRSCQFSSRLLAMWTKWQLMWWPQQGLVRSTWRKNVSTVWFVYQISVASDEHLSNNFKHVSCADTMDFSGMSLIKLRKEEMESQVSHGQWDCEGFKEWLECICALLLMLYMLDTKNVHASYILIIKLNQTLKCKSPGII